MITTVLATALERLANSSDPRTVQISSRFDAVHVPRISLNAYLKRIVKYARCNDDMLVYSLILIDRILLSGALKLSRHNVHRLLLSSVLVSVKFNDDFFYPNSYFAKVGGVSTAEINMLEIEFLRLIRFEVYTTDLQFQSYKDELGRLARANVVKSAPPPCPAASFSDCQSERHTAAAKMARMGEGVATVQT